MQNSSAFLASPNILRWAILQCRTYMAYFQMGKLKFLKKFTDLLKIPST